MGILSKEETVHTPTFKKSKLGQMHNSVTKDNSTIFKWDVIINWRKVVKKVFFTRHKSPTGLFY